MFQILVLSHGEFSRELVKSAEMIVGEQSDGIEAICLPQNQNMDEYYHKIEDTVLKFSEKGGTLILADIMGGSTFINAAKVYHAMENKVPVALVTGVNLPMLIEVINCRSYSSLEQAKKIAVSEGIGSIKDFTTGK